MSSTTTVVTEKEFRDSVDYCFKALDMDRNDFLDWPECKDFIKGVMSAKGGYNPDSFKDQYEVMDKNDDGKISKVELIERVVEVGRENGLFGNAQATAEAESADAADQPAEAVDADDSVDPQLFRKNLSCLGKTFNNARHAYLQLDIVQSDLTTIKGIEKFRFLQTVNVQGNNLTHLRNFSALKHLIKLNASNNHLTKMLDFDPPANLEWVDLSLNQIERIENVTRNKYLKHLYLDKNNIKFIEGVCENTSLRVLSLSSNQIQKIENLDALMLEELYLADNQIQKITGLELLRVLRTLDLSKNQITKLQGLQMIESLRFLNLSLNTIEKVLQLKYIEQLALLTELDLCFNPIQNKKHYRLQVLFHIPQLRMLDGVEIQAEEKVKAENLHGVDVNDRQIIFKTLLPQEEFVDRRIHVYEDIEAESDDPESESEIPLGTVDGSLRDKTATNSASSTLQLARNYVGELIQRVTYNEGVANFVQ